MDGPPPQLIQTCPLERPNNPPSYDESLYPSLNSSTSQDVSVRPKVRLQTHSTFVTYGNLNGPIQGEKKNFKGLYLIMLI